MMGGGGSQQTNKGQVCGGGAEETGKIAGQVIGTAVGMYFGYPGGGQVGGMVGQQAGKMIDPSMCVDRLNPNKAGGKPPMPPGASGGPPSSATDSVTQPDTRTSHVFLEPQQRPQSREEEDRYDQLARAMTYGGSEDNYQEYGQYR